MMTLDKEKFEAGIGQVIKCTNTDVLADIQTLVETLKDEADNPLLTQVFDAGKKFQQIYNDSFKVSVDALISDFRNVYDITEMITKASLGEVESVDASFATSGIDATSVSL